jgi:hypothetical protein
MLHCNNSRPYISRNYISYTENSPPGVLYKNNHKNNHSTPSHISDVRIEYLKFKLIATPLLTYLMGELNTHNTPSHIPRELLQHPLEKRTLLAGYGS